MLRHAQPLAEAAQCAEAGPRSLAREPELVLESLLAELGLEELGRLAELLCARCLLLLERSGLQGEVELCLGLLSPDATDELAEPIVCDMFVSRMLWPTPNIRNTRKVTTVSTATGIEVLIVSPAFKPR